MNLRRIGRRRLALAPLLLLSLARLASAQDSNYWTYQYGTRANLLGGAVVGSAVDLSAAYYNPGALALIDDPDVISTSKVFELSSLTIEPNAGVQVDLDNLRFALAPGFVGGRLPFEFLGRNQLAYSIFTRQQFKATLDAAAVGSGDRIGVSEDLFGSIRLEQDLNEVWVGASYSQALGRNAGLGATLYGAHRSQKLSSLGQLQAFSDSIQSIALRESRYSYWNMRLLLKIGLTYEWHRLSLGLTYTLRSVSLFGSGKVLLNRTLFGVENPTFVVTVQDGLGATFKSPQSLALGATYSPYPHTTVHLTSEYFAEVNKYAVLDLDPLVGQSTGDTTALDLNDARSDVWNVGVGLDHDFTTTLTGFASFRTDFSSASGDPEVQLTVTSWNLYHVTAGVAVRIGTADLTLGLGYGWGGQSDVEFFALPRTTQEEIPQPERADIGYRSLRFIMSFAL